MCSTVLKTRIKFPIVLLYDQFWKSGSNLEWKQVTKQILYIFNISNFVLRTEWYHINSNRYTDIHSGHTWFIKSKSGMSAPRAVCVIAWDWICGLLRYLPQTIRIHWPSCLKRETLNTNANKWGWQNRWVIVLLDVFKE